MSVSGEKETRICLEKKKKDEAVVEFICLDYILLASGCKIFIRNATVRVVNNSLILLMVLIYAVDFYSSYSEAEERGRSTFTLLVKFCDCCDEVAGLLFIVIMNNNRHIFAKRMKNLMQTMTEHQRLQLTRLSFWCMMAVIVTTTLDLVLTMVHLSIGKHWGNTWHVISDINSSFTLLNSWFLGGCFVYAFCVKIIRFSEENYFKKLNDTITMSCNEESALRLAYERRQLMNIKKELMDSFSFIPLLWFVNAFIKSTAMFLDIIEQYYDWLDNIWRDLPLLEGIFALVFIVRLCDSCIQYTRKQVNNVSLSMMSNGSFNVMTVYVSELNNDKAQEFVVFDTFPMNRSFILAFVSSLISFTALFLEVIYSYIRNSASDSPPCNCTSYH